MGSEAIEGASKYEYAKEQILGLIRGLRGRRYCQEELVNMIKAELGILDRDLIDHVLEELKYEGYLWSQRGDLSKHFNLVKHIASPRSEDLAHASKIWPRMHQVVGFTR